MERLFFRLRAFPRGGIPAVIYLRAADGLKKNNCRSVVQEMKLGVIISVSDAETAWNAFRLADHAISKGDDVTCSWSGAAWITGIRAPNRSTAFLRPTNS